jgi:hypothetical protein
MKPTAANPGIIIAQVEGSGTATATDAELLQRPDQLLD